MRTKAFPERVEKYGSVATIYASSDESKGYTIAYHVRGKLVRKVRNSYEAAKALALSAVEQKGTGELDALTLTNHDCLIYQRAVASAGNGTRHKAPQGTIWMFPQPARRSCRWRGHSFAERSRRACSNFPAASLTAAASAGTCLCLDQMKRDPVPCPCS